MSNFFVQILKNLFSDKSQKKAKNHDSRIDSINQLTNNKQEVVNITNQSSSFKINLKTSNSEGLNEQKQLILNIEKDKQLSHSETNFYPSIAPNNNKITASLQKQINQLKKGEKLSLFPPKGEYVTQLVIRKPITLDGQDATICSQTAPVISIESDNVNINNLRIEIIDDQDKRNTEQSCAIYVKNPRNLTLNNIEVRGTIMGIPSEEGAWKYPSSINLGQIVYEQNSHFILRLFVPVDSQIITNISGLNFSSSSLKAGCNEITLKFDHIFPDTLINGNIFLVTSSVKRRFGFNAHIVDVVEKTDNSTNSTQEKILWEPENWLSLSKKTATSDDEIMTEKPSTSQQKSNNINNIIIETLEPPETVPFEHNKKSEDINDIKLQTATASELKESKAIIKKASKLSESNNVKTAQSTSSEKQEKSKLTLKRNQTPSEKTFLENSHVKSMDDEAISSKSKTEVSPIFSKSPSKISNNKQLENQPQPRTKVRKQSIPLGDFSVSSLSTPSNDNIQESLDNIAEESLKTTETELTSTNKSHHKETNKLATNSSRNKVKKHILKQNAQSMGSIFYSQTDQSKSCSDNDEESEKNKSQTENKSDNKVYFRNTKKVKIYPIFSNRAKYRVRATKYT